MRAALGKLRSAVASDPSSTLRAVVSGAAAAIEQSIEQMRKQQQLTVSQLITEIRGLHKRIDVLESAASPDLLTRLANRNEMTERIRLLTSGEYCLAADHRARLLAGGGAVRQGSRGRTGGRIRQTAAKQCSATAEAARWAVEEFVVLISAKKAGGLGKVISENLSGPYVCLKGGTAIRPAVQATVGIVDTQPKETADHVLRRIEVFFGR